MRVREEPITIRGTALSLSLFLEVSFVLCVLWGLAVPRLHAGWLLEAIMPGFTWLTPQSFIVGLVWSTLLGVYVAVVFVPLFNYFEGRREVEPLGARTATLGREEISRHP